MKTKSFEQLSKIYLEGRTNAHLEDLNLFFYCLYTIKNSQSPYGWVVSWYKEMNKVCRKMFIKFLHEQEETQILYQFIELL